MAIQKDIYGFELGDTREFIYAASSAAFGGASPSGVFVDATKARTGNAFLRMNPTGGSAAFARLAGGTVIGQSPTIANGSHTRVRVRAYFYFESFPGSARMFGQGTFFGNAVFWVRADGAFGVSSNTQSTITWSTASLSLNRWYQLIFDIDYAGGAASTTITVTATVTDDATPSAFSRSATVGSVLGTTAPGIDVLCFGDNGADTANSYNVRWDDITVFAVTGSDATAAPTMPTGTKISPLFLTGVTLQQWETGLYTDCDEQPLDQTSVGGLGDTMSSVLGNGTTVSFTKSAVPGGYVHALKVYHGIRVVAFGSGVVDAVVMGATYTLALTNAYQVAGLNPVVCTDFSGYYGAAVDASVFSVIKRNGTTQTYIGNLLAEVLWVDPTVAGVTGGTGAAAILPPMQIRGNTQIKRETIYDAQIAPDARIQASKIAGLAFPVFFQEEADSSDGMLGGGGSGGDIRSSGTVPFVGDQSMGSHRLRDVLDPSIAQDAATKNYVDTHVSGGTSYSGEVLLAELTASASATLDFASRNVAGQSGAIFQTDYDEYKVEILGLVPATNAVDLQWRLSTDGGATYDATAKYVSTILAWISSVSATAGEDPGTATTQFAMRKSGIVSNDAAYGVDAALRLSIPGGSKFPRFIGGFGFITNATVAQSVDFRGAYISATAINAIRFFFSSGNITSGVVRIYGLTKTAQSLQNAPAHGLVLLAAQTPSAVASVDFVSRNIGSLSGAIFQSDYDEYLIEFVNVVPGSSAIPQIRVSTDGGATFDSGTNYDWGWSFHYSGAPGSIFSAATNQINLRDSATTVAANGNWSGELRLFNPLSTSVFKTFLGHHGVRDNSVGMIWFHGGGAYRSTTAINALRVLVSAGTFSGTIRIYGVIKDTTYPVSSILTGTHASRPSAGNAGRIYLPNDGFDLGRDSGTAWETFGPMYPFKAPPTGVWSWLNQGSSTITESKDALQLYTPAHGATQDLNCREKTTPATPYTMTAYLITPGINKNNHQWGVFLRQAGAGTGTGRIIAFFNGQAAASVTVPGLDLFIADLASATSALGTFYRAINMSEVVRWFRIADDGTNITFSISADGRNWLPLLTQSRLTYLLQGPDRIGFFYHPSNSATPNIDGVVTVMSWKEE